MQFSVPVYQHLKYSYPLIVTYNLFVYILCLPGSSMDESGIELSPVGPKEPGVESCYYSKPALYCRSAKQTVLQVARKKTPSS